MNVLQETPRKDCFDSQKVLNHVIRKFSNCLWWAYAIDSIHSSEVIRHE